MVVRIDKADTRAQMLPFEYIVENNYWILKIMGDGKQVRVAHHSH